MSITDVPQHRHRRGAVLVLATSAAVGWSSLALAAEVSWINLGDGDFSDPSNWSPATVPGAADTAVFGLPNGLHRVTFESDVTNSNLRYNAGSALFLLQGHTYALTSDLVGHGRADFGTVAGQTAR